MMTPFFEHLDVRSTSDPVEALQARLDRFPWIFFKGTYKPGILQHPFLKRCFNWMTPNCYMKNVCFTNHQFKNCCLRVPGTDDPEVFRSFDQELGVICGKFHRHCHYRLESG